MIDVTTERLALDLVGSWASESPQVVSIYIAGDRLMLRLDNRALLAIDVEIVEPPAFDRYSRPGDDRLNP